VVALSTADTNNRVNSFSNRLLVALSTADTNKWSILLDQRFYVPTPEKTSLKYERTGPIRQRQRRLTKAQVAEMAAKYETGATVYELAAEFGCHRTTVAARLKKEGIAMRGQSPKPELIDLMVQLCESGLSFQEIGKRIGCCANTVRNCLRERRIQVRDTHRRTG
jgi:DNA-directed RNA polymerase specialized sigma24 family protein